MGRKAQWSSHFAPCSIHFVSVATCSLVSVLPLSAGGMWSASAAVMRFSNSLFFTSPGTTATAPLAASPLALFSTSSRSFAFSLPLSGPWQAKQFSLKIGRTSRLNCTSAAGAASDSKSSGRAKRMGESSGRAAGG